MSNYHVEPVDKPKALSSEAIKSLRSHQVKGISRRQLLRYSIGGSLAVWLLEVTAGSIGFLWPNLTGGFGGKVRIGTLEDIKLQNTALPIADGFPAYVPEARAFIVLIEPRPPAVRRGRRCAGIRRIAERQGALPALPASRLQAEPLPEELLVRVSVPWIALRPARDQGGRGDLRAGGAEHGPLRLERGRRRGADPRHRQDHARTAARRPRPARDHPAADADRLHLMTRGIR